VWSAVGAVYDRAYLVDSGKSARSAQRERDSAKPKKQTAPTVRSAA